MGSSAAELTRLVVSAVGRVKANFNDGSILVLSPSGKSFSIIQDGKQQRQLSDFVLSRHAAALAVVLEFRNMHMDQPCFCARLMKDVAPRLVEQPMLKGLAKCSSNKHACAQMT